MAFTLPATLPQRLIKLDAQSIIFFVPTTLFFYFIGLAIYRLWFHPLSKIPGPRLMAMIDIINQWRTNVDGTFIHEVSQLHKQFGPLVRIGPDRIAVDGSIGFPEVYSLKAKGQSGTFDKVHDYIFSGDHKTIVGAPNELHRRLRRTLAPAFSETAIREQEVIISKLVDKLVEQLTRKAELGETVDFLQWMNFTFFDIIGELTFARTFNSLETGEEHIFITNFFHSVIGNSYNRFLMAYPYLSIPFNMILGRKRVTSAMNGNLENIVMAQELSKERMKMGEEPKPGQRDFMTHMLKKNRDGEQAMPDEDIMLNTMILIVAGSETTSSAMTYFFYISSMNAAQKQILQNEIRSTFTDESEINMINCGQISYLQACIEETLRMFPPAAETPPRVSPGANIGGEFIPSGTIIHVYPWATFRNPNNFTDPDSFRPERWLLPTHPHYDARYAKDNLACVKPFSHGPRDCIGKNLAYNEMRLLISRLLFRFDYELLPGQETWHDNQRAFLLWDKQPLKVRFTVRKN
ncbi:putative benzoate 4-monooxygenase cytochrome p450 protein [Botrytis fragariae]|uniref:Putative benzoate 4-monooxygenase cytochrome p450 protein n=1 Tax=Botrytis fragariae TaxID=1964551 RepID=A0A8H6ECX6_9HELO|nr:putative benzoate 4-monooxygenase cytochrome p450 protein [Botrytis fragariae]KAF5867749.1 putative benzoate 4-monooxygenase cytochrome p450 protein [Botrytis fragariae]